jgi:Na+/proline symporter
VLNGRFRSSIYALTLAVYCTSWTFFGSVGLASLTGLDFLGIYLGPILVIGFGHGFVRRVVQLTKSQNILSVSDFVAARYGKSSRVAALVAFIAVIGSIPYIALQLKAITVSLKTLLDAVPGSVAGVSTPTSGALALAVAIVLAGFTVTFGTRHIDVREHHTGLTIAVAFESAIKLVAFLTVGIFVA